MRLHRFYIGEPIGDLPAQAGKKEIVVDSPELANQIFKVFRLKTGDDVIFFDGSGTDYQCTISESKKVDQKLVSFTVKSNTPSRYMPAHEVTLCSSIVKKDTFEWIVEKATELGVSTIVPIIAERSEKKDLNMDRLKKIAVEASEQSGRGNVPMIHPVITLGECIKLLKEKESPAIVFHTGDRAEVAPRINLGETYAGKELAIFIGPEGGWSEKEIGLFHTENFHIYSLGSQVLRAETAVIAALSKVLL